MKNIFRILFIISFSFYQILVPQIVVVRKNASGDYGPLTAEDITDERISMILWKYTWPSCIAQDLTEEEKEILLKPSSINNEEKFIRLKLQEISSDLDVVFVPNTLYELFLIKKSSNNFFNSFSVEAIANLLNKSIDELKVLQNQENYSGSLIAFVQYKISSIYNKCNEKIFLKNNNVVMTLKSQKEFIEFSLLTCLDKRFKNSVDLSLFIDDQKEKFVNLLDQLPTLLTYKGQGTRIPINIPLCLKCINLDYIAYAQNRAILLRGTSFVNKKTIFKKQISAIGSTIYNDNVPYSISFGNSLFAGYVYDVDGCSHQFFMSLDNKNLLDIWKKSVVGYALIINKYEYVDNYISNLFFVSGLSLEAGLFGKGEFFHSRTKPAVLTKSDIPIIVKGFPRFYNFLDPFGIFLITRDPYKQAKLFSDYIANHMVVLQEGDTASLAGVEIKGFHKLFNNQKKLTKEYKVIEFLNSKSREWKKKKLFVPKQQNQQPILPVVASNAPAKSNAAQVAGLNFLEWIYGLFQTS